MKNKTYAALSVVVLVIGFFAIFYANSASAATIDDQYTVTVNVDGSGSSVTVDPAQDTYNYSDSVQLTPVAAPDWYFSHWSGDLTGSETPANITMTSNMTINALFTQDTYTLTIYIEGNGTVSPGNKTIPSGASGSLEAINDENWTFSGWSGDVTGTTNTTLTMDGNKTITATFTLNDNSPSPTPTPTPAPTATPTPTPVPTATHRPSATATPSPAPTATANPTVQPTVAPKTEQSSLSTYLAVIGAAIILVVLTIGLIAHKRKKHLGMFA